MTGPQELQELFAALCEAMEPCPDCAEITTTVVVDGTVQVIHQHDETCPNYQRMQQETE